MVECPGRKPNCFFGINCVSSSAVLRRDLMIFLDNLPMEEGSWWDGRYGAGFWEFWFDFSIMIMSIMSYHYGLWIPGRYLWCGAQLAYKILGICLHFVIDAISLSSTCLFPSGRNWFYNSFTSCFVRVLWKKYLSCVHLFFDFLLKKFFF